MAGVFSIICRSLVYKELQVTRCRFIIIMHHSDLMLHLMPFNSHEQPLMALCFGYQHNLLTPPRVYWIATSRSNDVAQRGEEGQTRYNGSERGRNKGRGRRKDESKKETRTHNSAYSLTHRFLEHPRCDLCHHRRDHHQVRRGAVGSLWFPRVSIVTAAPRQRGSSPEGWWAGNSSSSSSSSFTENRFTCLISPLEHFYHSHSFYHVSIF